MSSRLLLFLLCQLFVCSGIQAIPVVEQFQDLEVNWSRHRIRFLGAAALESDSETFADVEEKAWQKGLYLALGQVASLYDRLYSHNVENTQFGQASSEGQQAGNRVTSATFSYANEYLANGAVRVHLGSSLATALMADHLGLSEHKDLEG
ncbi:MAG: hypothetical protein OXT67_02695, partial [Zetaproteobacteria bacterium]|nr:hypothetical protein [Zetaproteobacteria bacterium]